MRKVVLFIAMSLDGYIADKNSGVEWLMGQDSAVETNDSYAAFEQIFSKVEQEIKLRLITSKNSNGITELIDEKR